MNSQEEILKRIVKHPGKDELHISRVPKQTKELFKEYANAFCGDYGMALKQLLDFKLQFEPMIEQVHALLNDHEGRIANLESAPSEKEEIKKRTTLSGRPLE